MKRDRQLAMALVRGFNQMSWGNYDHFSFPEDIAGHVEAVDVIAIAPSGTRLAVEHTTVLPFLGEREDTIAFAEVFSQLESDPLFRLPEFGIDVHIPIGVIPRGKSAKELRRHARETVCSWFLKEAIKFPVGCSRQQVPHLGFDHTLIIIKEPHRESRVFLFRSGLPDTFGDVVGKAVRDKIPKLSRSDTDKKVLLLEKDNLPRGYVEAARHLDDSIVSSEYNNALDEIWMVNTASWDLGGDLWFLKIWPGGVTSRFRMHAPAGHAELAELVRAA